MGEGMKSSTLRRSNITREKIAMLSALSNYNALKGNSNMNITDKQAELDVLWQNFKVSTSSDNASRVQFGFGFISGVVVTLIATALISFIAGSSLFGNNINHSIKNSDNVKFTFVPADKQPVQDVEPISQNKEYIVQSGDSLEDISMRFYGRFDESKLKAIQEINKLPDMNSIRIGQKLIIPMPQHQ